MRTFSKLDYTQETHPGRCEFCPCAGFCTAYSYTRSSALTDLACCYAMAMRSFSVFVEAHSTVSAELVKAALEGAFATFRTRWERYTTERLNGKHSEDPKGLYAAIKGSWETLCATWKIPATTPPTLG